MPPPLENVKSTESDSTQIQTPNDKIDVIQQKFSEFETMYTQSQNEFIETFRNLDERQKIYMNDIQHSIKEIVEKSLEKYESTMQLHKSDNNHEETTVEMEKMHVSIDEKNSNTMNGLMNDNDQDDDLCSEHSLTDGSIQENGKIDETVYPIVIPNESKKMIKKIPKPLKRSKKCTNNNSRGTVVIEFEKRLHQLGVDANSPGLSTPKTIEVSKEMADEREEIKKVNLNFYFKRILNSFFFFIIL